VHDRGRVLDPVRMKSARRRPASRRAAAAAEAPQVSPRYGPALREACVLPIVVSRDASR